MFVALVPPAEVIDDIGRFLEPRCEAAAALRWTEPYQWHLTLAFLPEVGPRSLDALVERLARTAARSDPFALTLGGSGAFPSPDRARVIWLGASTVPPESLTQLAVGVRAAANKAGTVVGGGRFRPHLTLARVRQPQDATSWLRILGSYGGRSWTAGSIDLIQSHLGQGRGGHPRYEPIASMPIAGRLDAVADQD